ncbi:hypothetical protein F5Y13DRAFT_207382 [Hypoxylon sp. FL1857]|nr:hypothetical protein F5Y13DRAFT_207382 [Hypoxylon sp. FL1857]
MAFGFGNTGNASGGLGGGVSQGPELGFIQTEALGFLSLAGDAKLRLTSQWSPPPAENASLLSIASRQGLVAAAGPDAVVLASTESVRKAFEGPKDGDSNIRAFQPQLKLPLPIRICQLAFTADETYLILSAEQGGGLAVYEVQALQQGSTQAAFEIPTNGESLRALVPNPRPEKGELCAVVTNEGKLLMANMKERNFIPGPNGQILKDQVSCVAWSNKGKQLVAGLGDGTMLQMTPEGAVKAEIPRPPDLTPSYFVSSLVWLENDTRCHIITRQGQNFQFQNLGDPVDPFGSDKTPHHTIMRLKDFPPNLQDLLICSSTASPDIGLLTRSKTPLAPDTDDSKRATLPMGDDGMESPNVYKPIPTDELDQSPGPLPGYWVLNAEGSIRGGTTYPGLAAVEGNAPGSIETATSKAAQSNPFSQPAASPFGASPSTLGSKSSPWGAQPSSGGASGPTFGSNSFGTGAASSAPKFGQSSFGTTASPASSPWASAAASSGTPVFGQSSFGSNANNAVESGSPFGGANISSAPSSGFASLGSNSSAGGSMSMDTDTTSIFRAPSTKPSTGNVFGSQPFKLTSSFQRDPYDKDDINEEAPKAEKSLLSGFTSTLDESTKPAASNPFATGTQSSFGQLTAPSTNVESTTPTSTPAPSKFLSPTSSTPQGKGLFDFHSKTPSGLSSVLESAASQTPTAETPQVKVEQDTPRPLKDIPGAPLPPESTSRAAYPLGDSSSSSAATADASDFKRTPPKAEDAPLPPDLADSTTPTDTDHETQGEESPVAGGDAPLPPDPITNKKAYNAPLPQLPGTFLKPKPTNDPPRAANDAPLPPDPVTNKKAYNAPLPPLPGTVTKPKPIDDSPLPPDPIKQPQAYEAKLPALPIAKPASEVVGPGFKFPTNLPPVPSDSDEDDLSEEGEGTEAASEGSGVDVAKELSPSSTGVNKTPGFTPQSSFDGLAASYSTISRPDQEGRTFFGELGRNAPVFPQPSPLSPRSPSPVRGSLPPRMLGKDQPRSFSAPSMASQILVASRRGQSRLGSSIISKDTYVEDAIVEQQRKAKAKKEAEENQLLLDEEDDTVQSLLRTEVQPTLELDEFIAHSGVAPPAGDSVPAQVEAVYRDINSMIDTLGLNARSLAGFTKGHKELKTEKYTRQDLAAPEDWTLIGLEDLAQIIDQDLSDALDGARVKDIAGKLAECEDIQRELARDRNKQADLKKIIASRLDPEQTIAIKALPLSAEQAAQQSDLRREYAKFTKLLAEAEENLTLLKAKIVSANSAIGKGGPTPTIEAVVRTITKLTSMVEKRSGDIDVLENQIRKLRLGSHGPGAGSREGSPFATPNPKRLTASVFSPERSVRESTPQRSSVLRHSISGSIGGGIFNTPPRKKLSGFGDTEKKAVKEKRERRTAVLGKLKSSLEKKGVGVWAVDDIE